jgi:cell division protein FtsB
MRETGSTAWFVSFGLLVFTMVAVPLLIFDEKSLPRYQSLRAQLERSEASAAQIEREVEVLRKQVARLRDDPQAVERIARDELGMIRGDELIFQFPQ